MNQKIIELNKSLRTKKMPQIRVGDIVRVHKRIKEGEKERVQIFKGFVLSIKGGQSSSPTITVRRVSSGVGVEITVPIYLPTIEKIEVLRHNKVRQSKIYYMRQRAGKSAKLKAIDLTEEEQNFQKEIDEELKKSKEEAKKS